MGQGPDEGLGPAKASIIASGSRALPPSRGRAGRVRPSAKGRAGRAAPLVCRRRDCCPKPPPDSGLQRKGLEAPDDCPLSQLLAHAKDGEAEHAKIRFIRTIDD